VPSFGAMFFGMFLGGITPEMFHFSDFDVEVTPYGTAYVNRDVVNNVVATLGGK